MPRLRSDQGQASVELVALLPLLAVLALAGWQLVVAGQAAWLAGTAARAAARAQALDRNPLTAARGALPPGLRSGVGVREEQDGAVAVRIAIPAVIGRARLGTVGARARFAEQGGS